MRAALAWTRVRRASSVVAVTLVAAGMTAACGSGDGHGTLQAAPPEPTPAVTTQVRFIDLPRDAASGTYYLADQEIHTASGQVIPLRLDGFIPDTHGSTRYDFSLVGLSPRGYVVERTPGPYNDAGFAEADLVTASSTSLIDRSPMPGPAGYILSSDGTRLVRVVYGIHDPAQLTVLDLDGTPLASTSAHGGDTPYLLSATGSSVWYQQHDGLDGIEGGISRWDYQAGTTTDSHSVGWYADPGHDLLFVGPPDGLIGPTSLRAPSQVAWRYDFAPMAVSADDTYVAGVSPVYDLEDDQPTGVPFTVEVRRVDDGALVDSFTFPEGAWFTDAWWGENDTLFLAVSFHTTSSAGRLVRCSLAGGCDLVGPLVTGSYSHGPALGWDLDDA